MKKYIPLLFAVALAVMATVSCTKEPLPYAGTSPDPASFEHFVTPAADAVSISSTLDGLTLTVTGAPVSYSHTDAISLTARLTAADGTVTDVTKKAVWAIPGLDPVTVTDGTVASKYRDVHDIPYTQYEPGVLPETETTVKVTCTAGSTVLTVKFPVLFKRTVWIGVSAEARYNGWSANAYEFRPVASHPVPFDVNVVMNTGHSGSLIWQIEKGNTTGEYRTNPGYPVTNADEAAGSEAWYTSYNDYDQSSRVYVTADKTTYILVPEALRKGKNLSYGKD